MEAVDRKTKQNKTKILTNFQPNYFPLSDAYPSRRDIRRRVVP